MRAVRTSVLLALAGLAACAGGPPREVREALLLRMDTRTGIFPTDTAAAAPAAARPEAGGPRVARAPTATPLKRFRLSARLGERLDAPAPARPAGKKKPAAIAMIPDVAPQNPARKGRHNSSQQDAEDAYRNAGEAVLRGDLDAAESGYLRALTLQPRLHAARVALAALMIDGNRYDEADRVIAPGLILAPEDPSLRMLRARVQAGGGDDQAALDGLLDYVPEFEVQPDYHALIAALRQRLGQHVEAVEAYQALVKLRPDEGAWWVGLGISEEAIGRPEAARTAFQTAQQTGRLPEVLSRYAGARLAALQYR